MNRIPKRKAEELLEDSIGPTAAFRSQQWEAIDSLVNGRNRLLLIQRTGWGKSTVYFIATKLLRMQNEGPTLLISPLLSLMSNQIEDAESQLDLSAATIHSNNRENWESAIRQITSGKCDILLVSPERLSNETFQSEVLEEMADEFGLLVVDEAHCISDWGHDFRPDYQRIRDFVEQLPTDTPVVATTATANDRVIKDVTNQLPGIKTIKGDLVRESIRIQAIDCGSRPTRLAWLAENLPDTEAAGIIYCLTTTDVERVTDWLQHHEYRAEAYHGRLDSDHRQKIEHHLMENTVDVVVATNALGMGFNKPDIGFIIHFQRPPNLIRYYQEIGRAGRDIDEAYAVLLSGDSDDEVAIYFIENAYPSQDDCDLVMEVLAQSDEPLYKYQILKRVNVSASAVDTLLDILQVNNAIKRVDDGFIGTDHSWSFDRDRTEEITSHRYDELREITEFVTTDACLTKYIDSVLDGSLTEPCGYCANCHGPIFPETITDQSLLTEATRFYRRRGFREITPRKRLPEKHGTYSQISSDKQIEPGYTLSSLSDPGWGPVVKAAMQGDSDELDQLVAAASEFITETWNPHPAPTWITTVPSNMNPQILEEFSQELADNLDVPYASVVEQTREIRNQNEFENSYQQCWNVLDAFTITTDARNDPVLVIDDIVGSRWTLTEVGRKLRVAGSGIVYPFALSHRR